LNYDGDGVGLFLCKQLIEGIGGTIEIHSRGQDEGTTVRLILPMQTASEEQVRAVDWSETGIQDFKSFLTFFDYNGLARPRPSR